MSKQITIIAAAAMLLCIIAPTASRADEPKTYKLLTANVGNADILFCNDYMFKLCRIDMEKKIGEAIRAMSPDIVSLQEVYDPSWCEKKPPEKNKKRVCYNYKTMAPIDQVRRLLGDGYTVVCDGRSNYECIGVKKGAGTIDGCPEGGICKGPAAAITLPEPDGCEPYPVIFGVNAVVGGTKIRIVNSHPAASNAKCREGDVYNLFNPLGGVRPLADVKLNTIAMGDFNTDPFHGTDDPAAELLRKNVGTDKPFYYLSGPAEHDPPILTNGIRTIDHVFTNFATGSCKTYGLDKEHPRLDGTVGDPDPSGTDHNPILCEISLTK